jgi:DNA-directed RNA polymerase subunit N (RpoN/RPB10)
MDSQLNNVSFEEVSMMPMRCYGCGEAFRHGLIIESLKSGKSLKDTMDQLKYRRLCCRNQLLVQPSIVKLQKKIEHDQVVDRQLSQLTLESTAPGYQGHVSTSALQIIDEAPPGMSQGSLFFPDTEVAEVENGDINPFEYFVSQLEAPDDEDLG